MNAGFASRALWRPLRPLRAPQPPAAVHRCFGTGAPPPVQAARTAPFTTQGARRPPPARGAVADRPRRLLSTRVSGHDHAKTDVLLDIQPEAKAPVQTGGRAAAAASSVPPPVAATASTTAASTTATTAPATATTIATTIATTTATASATATATATAATTTTSTATVPPDHLLAAPHPPTNDPIPVANSVPPLPLWQRLGPLTWAADSYGRAQRRRPYVVQVVSALVIALCADLSVQRMNRHRAGYDPQRTARSLVIGAVAAVPGWLWFVFLARHFNYAASRALSVAVKVAVNQVVYTPLFNTYFFGMQALLAGESLAAAWQRVRTTVPVSFVNSFKVWPAVTAVNFAFVPLEYRSVVAGVVAVGWQTYLVYLNRSAEDAAAAQAVQAVQTAQAVPAAPTAQDGKAAVVAQEAAKGVQAA